MKKVLFYIDHRNRGGAQRVMVELANYFQRNNLFEVFFLTQFVSNDNAYALDEHIKEFTGEEQEDRNFVNKQIHRVRQLENVCKKIKPDIIISFLIISNIIALIAGKKNKIPVLISVRNDPTHDHSRLLHLLMRATYPTAAGWVFQTKDAKEYFKKWIKGIDDIIVNPVSIEVMEEIEHGRIMGENQNNIVSVGRLDKQKRHDLLIRAYYLACGRKHMSKLVIYGEGAERRNLEILIETLGLREKVVLAGTTENVVEKIRSARMFVLASDYEGMPNALLEAMAVGLPVISTNCPCGGPAMLIEDGVNGLLVDVGNEQMLADRIKKILNNEEMAKKMGEKAALIRHKCSMTDVAECWQNMINRCIE